MADTGWELRIAIAMAIYEPQRAYFREQLASIAAQTVRSWTCIVTADSPLEDLRSDPQLAEFFDDPRFVWSENAERLGHRRNFRHAIERAAALDVDAIATADQDDVWYPRKLEKLAARLATAPPLALVHCDMHLLRDGEAPTRSVWRHERRNVAHVTTAELILRNVVTGCSMLFDAALARRYGAIPDVFTYHDHWYALVASCHGGVHPVDEPLMGYRQHGANVIGSQEFQWRVTLPDGPIAEEAGEWAARWRTARARAEALVASGAPVSRSFRMLYLGTGELGLGFLARGAAHTLSDPKLSRTEIRVGIGKQIELFRKGSNR